MAISIRPATIRVNESANFLCAPACQLFSAQRNTGNHVMPAMYPLYRSLRFWPPWPSSRPSGSKPITDDGLRHVLESLWPRCHEARSRSAELLLESLTQTDLPRFRPISDPRRDVHRHAVDVAVVHLDHLTPMKTAVKRERGEPQGSRADGDRAVQFLDPRQAFPGVAESHDYPVPRGFHHSSAAGIGDKVRLLLQQSGGQECRRLILSRERGVTG